MDKLYTIGEIFNQGLLKTWKGEPYKDKAAISKIVNSLPYTVKKTAWGQAKCLTQKQIEAYNKKRIIQDNHYKYD